MKDREIKQAMKDAVWWLMHALNATVDDADDAVQSAFVDIIDSGEEPRSLKNTLISYAKNRYLKNADLADNKNTVSAGWIF